MSKKQKIIPELRFPEFKNEGNWHEKKISELGETINGLTGKSGEDFGTGKPFVTYKQVFANSIIDFQKCGKVQIGKNENQNTLQHGDILFTTSSETPNEVGFASVLVDSPKEETYLNSFCFSIRPFNLKETQPQFSRYLFHSPIYRKAITALAQGSTRYNISKVAFLNLKLPIPKPLEQQKIASCLSSLDQVIEAHRQKLELLKNHKIGLIQNLFAQESERLPKWRFKEFKGEWKGELLGDIYTFKVTNSFTRDDLNYEIGSVKNIHYGDIHKKFATLFDIEREKVPFINPSVSIAKINPECYCTEGDIIFADASEDLKDVGKSIEIVNLNNEKLLSGMHTLLAKQRETKLIVGFGGHLFRSNAIRIEIQKLAQGTKVLGISSGRLSNIKIWYPENKKEQEKIASCLSALDEIITVQTEEIEQLKRHKKGLMQGLFPKIIG